MASAGDTLANSKYMYYELIIIRIFAMKLVLTVYLVFSSKQSQQVGGNVLSKGLPLQHFFT